MDSPATTGAISTATRPRAMGTRLMTSRTCSSRAPRAARTASARTTHCSRTSLATPATSGLRLMTAPRQRWRGDIRSKVLGTSSARAVFHVGYVLSRASTTGSSWTRRGSPATSGSTKIAALLLLIMDTHKLARTSSSHHARFRVLAAPHEMPSMYPLLRLPQRQLLHKMQQPRFPRCVHRTR